LQQACAAGGAELFCDGSGKVYQNVFCAACNGANGTHFPTAAGSCKNSSCQACSGASSPVRPGCQAIARLHGPSSVGRTTTNATCPLSLFSPDTCSNRPTPP
jgi:hypothetical protein